MRVVSMLSLTGILFLPVLASAQGALPTHDPRAAFAAADKNHDGRIDHEEFHHRIVQIFYFADDDRDGYVSNGQLKTFDEASLFVIADLDGDGRLSLYEFINARFVNFREADDDASGTLSVEEVVSAFEE
jgi:Ca2+-binding EF-hand superfamily protein